MRRIRLASFFATVFCLNVVAALQARAADTVIGFDDLPNGMQVSTQYHDKGVDLDTKLGRGALQFPVVAAEPAVVSPPNVLDISARYPNESPGAYLQGIFTNPHHTKVGVQVHHRGSQTSPQTGTTTLQAFDLSGKLVGSTTAVAPSEPGNGFAFLQVTSSAANIARFVVQCFNASISLDDLTFDELTAAPGPDFAVVATAAQLPVGGSGSTSVFLRRFNGSSGDVRFELSNLPQGVAVASETVNPISGPDGASSIVTLSADASAQPVQNWPVSVTGFPSATAGQFGPHSSTFPLTILDAYDAQVVGIEVTQAIQPYDLPTGSVGNRPLHGTPVRYNGMPLAAGGRTVVRMFPNLALFPAVTSVPDFFCSLSGTRDGAPLPGGPIQTGPGPNPLILGANFVGDLTRARGKECDFILPEDWTRGVISLTARISPVPSLLPPTSVDCCLDNDSFTLTDIAFTPTRDLFFAPFALRVNGGPLGFPDDIFSDARNLLPLGETQFHMGDFAGEIDITDIWNQDVKACGILGLGSCSEDETGRGASVAARLRDFADEMNFTESGELVVGIFPQSDPVSGQSDRIRGLEQHGCTGPFWDCDDLQVAVVQNQLRPLTSVAHELGHRLGRSHASFDCGAGDVDNNGPAEHWPPDEHGFIQGVGVDRRSFQVRFPDRTGGQLGGPFYDFMSYCANNSNDPDSWISRIGWTESITNLETGPPGSSMPVSPARPSRLVTAGALRPVLVVQGFADLQGNVSVTKIAEYRRPPRPAPSSSHFEVVVHTPGGMVLGRQPMETVLGIAHNLPGTVKFLSAEIPASGAAAIEIFRDGILVARRERGKHRPSVHDVDVHRRRRHEECGAQGSTHGGCPHEAEDGNDAPVILVTWHTRYLGTASLRAKVDFSADDGATWRPVFFGSDRGRVVLRESTLTPSQTARIRVRLSDGFNEAEAVSRKFREPGGKPVLRIDSPRGVSEVRVGQTVYLSGSAYDAAHQRMPGEQMRWFIGDRFIGSGQSVAISSLPVGDAVIRLAVTTADGRAVSQEVKIRILPR